MEVVIVGAGPVGCYTAQLLKNTGIKIRIIEEDEEVGKPISCAGLVGRQVFNDLLLPFDKSSIINQIDGASFYYHDDTFQIKREGVAYVIDREKFDKNMSKGINVECGKKLIEISAEGSGYLLKTHHEVIHADLIIGADGVNSQVRKYINFIDNNCIDDKKRDCVKCYLGLQYKIKLEKSLSFHKEAQVYFREGIPFFIWVIPESKNIVRVGIISKNARKDLEEFLENSKFKGKLIEKLSGMIPMGIEKNYYQNIALVGDAAAQVKPLTGGGIYYGLKSAELLAESIKDGKLIEYDKRLKKEHAKEIKFGMKARKLYEEINEKELKNIFSMFKKNAKFIEKVANFENHSVIFLEILKNPKILGNVGGILSRNIGKLFI